MTTPQGEHAQVAALTSAPADCGNTPYDEGPFTLEQPTAAPQGVAYAELPQHYSAAAELGLDGLFTADQMRDFADATHALRASHGQAPAGAANTKTHELLSTTVGLLMGYREGAARQPYKPRSMIAKVVDEVVDHLKDWPEPAPTAPAAPAGAAWRDHVEQRLLTWRQRFVNRSGDQLALDDFMDKQSLEDLIDFVCDEYAAPTAQAAPAQQVIIDFAQVGTAGPFAVVNGRVSLPDATMQDLVRMLRPTYEAQAAPAEAAPSPATIPRAYLGREQGAYEAGWKDGYKHGAWAATTPTAPAAGAVAGLEPTQEMLDVLIAVTHRTDDPMQGLRAALAAAPTPAAQADSVLEDAALLHYALADGGNQSMNWQDVYDDWNGEGYFIDALRAAYKQDADRKQGAKHD